MTGCRQAEHQTLPHVMLGIMQAPTMEPVIGLQGQQPVLPSPDCAAAKAHCALHMTHHLTFPDHHQAVPLRHTIIAC